MTTDAEFIEQINTLKVSAQLLGEVTLIWASLPPEIWNDFDRRLEQVLDHVGKTREQHFLKPIVKHMPR